MTNEEAMMGINDPKKDEDAEMFDEEEDLLEAPHPKTKEEALEEDFQVKLEEMRTQVFRTHAEMENLRQRTEKRIKDERQYALSSFAEKLVRSEERRVGKECRSR